MNLKNFKKVHEDEEKAILRNDRGHEIRVAKKGLSEKHRKDLDNLKLHAADGTDTIDQALNAQDELKQQALDQYDTQQAEQAPATPPQSIAPQPAAPQEARQPAASPAPVAEQPLPAPSLQQMVAQKRPEQVREEAKQKYIADHASDMGIQDAKWGQDLENGHVDAKTYSQLFAEKSTLGKIGTIFGLMLEGIGSGMTHQPSQALQMMNNVVQQDLEAQKTSKGNAQNYMTLSYQHELQKAQKGLAEAQTQGVDAETALKNAQLEAFYRANGGARNKSSIAALQSLQDQVNKFPNGPDKLKAQQLLDGIKKANAQQILQTNHKIATQMADDPEGAFNARQKMLLSTGMVGLPGGSEIAQNEASKHVPHVGDASIPVPDHVRTELVAHKKLQDAAKDLFNFTQKHTTLVPGTPNYNVGEEKAEVLRQMIREGMLGTVFRESEKPLLEKFVPKNPGGFLKVIQSQPKLKTLLESNEAQGNALKEAYGLPVEHGKKHSSPEMKKQINKKTGEVRWVPK